ncbi:AfsR/SARP family transcriptional regulator [Planctomonas deserti]|uniref:AfsR/SARP family transcriptional regulator n=1 Tax=Planctomonas deserti TaxID=2144185 RepID=UPI001F0C67CE|nr:BTAD domain-containing putative transcriptional regulator [Planctomonas deserti]
MMAHSSRRVSIVGGLGVFPAVRLSLPSRRLFAFLALQGEPVSRARAAGSLWPDMLESHSRANLRRATWQSPSDWIAADGDSLELHAEVDLTAARASATRAIGGGILSLDEITRLSQDLLPGWNEEWVLPHQDAFRLLRVQALEAACRTMAARGLFALATQAGTAALAAEPLRESAAAALIYAHLGEGNRYAAACRFRDFSRTLHDELGVHPDPGLTAAVVAAVGGISDTEQLPPSSLQRRFR